ncbi:chemotaxis protein CheA [Sandaracinus amylolyticus]|uniref:histidine kinase n=1 Tax=Sandaracinus amylolyticus TaxID=927083 RepID=A0A0F6SGE8_9BACT|nr:chemotaxis protein CheA [Sandaracinus amylolyticus]AKF08569.1 Signal transduction histidine kinase CheA [Sandaracinus amylolyticus]
MSDEVERIREEFLAESQEIIESLSRDLLLLDHGQKEGKPDPDLVNSVFRGVHTLKGIAGMFGHVALSELAHELEDLLDQLRLGKIPLSQEALDVMFEGVEVLQRLLGAARRNADPASEVDLATFRRSLQMLMGLQSQPPRLDALGGYDLDPGVLTVLTEYEEHRLRSNVEQSVPLYRLRVRFSLSSIDSDLEELKQRVKPWAEIITYLPSMEGGSDDAIDLEVLMASRTPVAELRDAIGGPDVTIEPVTRRDPGRTVPPPAPTTREGDDDAAAMKEPGAAVVRPPSVVPAKDANLGADALAVRTVAKTVRVDIEKLDHLMNLVGELGIVKSAVGRIVERLRQRADMRPLASELHRIHRAFERQLAGMQEGILDVRMVPLGQTFDRLGRAVRQVAREHGKDVRLVVTGAETEIDKLIVEELTDPLLHIIRNAVDHGIERAEARLAIGKPETGTLALNAYQKGSHVVIEIEDDGAGIDPARILSHAVSRGLLTAETGQDMSAEELRQLIFLPGFSTAAEVTDLSGRGVGMDVVKTNIGRLGGVIDVHSQVGIGTKFTLTLPITLAILSALVLRVRAQTFAIPLNVVQEALFLDETAVRLVEDHEVITLRGQSLPIVRLASLFGIAGEPTGARSFVVVTALGNRRLGLVVDALEGQQDIITKPLGKSLHNVRGFSGATDLGDQRVVLVLDAPSILEEVLASGDRRGVAA